MSSRGLNARLVKLEQKSLPRVPYTFVERQEHESTADARERCRAAGISDRTVVVVMERHDYAL